MNKLFYIMLIIFFVYGCGRATKVELPEGEDVQEYQYPPVYE